jgi:hypothetical protein
MTRLDDQQGSHGLIENKCMTVREKAFDVVETDIIRGLIHTLTATCASSFLVVAFAKVKVIPALDAMPKVVRSPCFNTGDMVGKKSRHWSRKMTVLRVVELGLANGED